MRDPARIDRVLNQLREVWMQVPDWRLGQLIVNAASLTGPIDIHKLVCLEDDKMERLLAALSNAITNRTAGHMRLGDVAWPEGVDQPDFPLRLTPQPPETIEEGESD